MTVVKDRPQAEKPASQPAHHYDLIIVGGGIVGLTLASALRCSGLTVVIVEAQTPEQAASRERAYAFSLASGEIFKKLGLWSTVSPRITHFDRVCLSDADYPVSVNFRPTDLGTEAVYYAAEHRVLMEALQASLVDRPTINYLAPATLEEVQHEPDQVRCTITQGNQVWRCTANLIVAADGARSRLRQQADIPTFGWQYWQACITTVLAPEKSHKNTAYERFWPSGPFAILPLPGDRCQIVWTAPRAEAESILQLPPDQFMAELKRRYGDQMGNLKILNKPLMFPVRLMQSRQYVQSRLALVGDAAHCCHPVGGQGLNMGIRDAAALAEVLVAADERGEAIGDLQVLKRYERWRQRENWFILSMTDFLTRSFSNNWLPLVWVRRLGIRVLESVPALKWLALTIMTGRFGRQPQISPGE